MNSVISLFLTVLAVCSIMSGCTRSKKKNQSEHATKEAAVNFDAVYVVNGEDASLSVLDASTRDVKSTIALMGTFPHHISLSPDRAKLAIAVPGMDLSEGHSAGPSSSAPSTGEEHGGGHGLTSMKSQVILLDAASGKILKSRDLPSMNHNASFSPNGLEVWTSQMTESGRVLVLDAATLDTKKEIIVGRFPAEITFSPDGTKAFVANGEDDTVTVIDVASKAVATTIPVGDNPVGAWPGGDGVMYVDNEAGKSISAIDSKTMSVVRTYALGFTPGMAATGPGNTLWVSDTDNGKVVIYAPGSTVKEGEVATGAGAHGVAFSADSQLAFVTNQKAETVSVIDVSKRKVIADAKVGKKPNGLVFRKN